MVAFTIILPYIFLTVDCYRTSICTGENEEFSFCGWKCPPTCVNLLLLGLNRAICPHRWECYVGCRCSAGYLRDEYSGNCVLVEDCPTSGLVVEAAPAGSYRTAKVHLRQKRSNYGHNQQYIAPCGAASAPIPSYASSPYHLSLAPAHHAAYAQHGYGGSIGGYGSLPHYRSENMLGEQEMMSFSDMDPMMSEHPMARFAYAAPPSSHYGAGLSGLLGPAALGGLVAPAAAGAHAFGVFPNANPGGCSVPLLLSCSPSIVPGRIVSAQPYSAGSAGLEAAGHAYRDVNELHHDTQESDQHVTHEDSAPQEMHHVEAQHQ